MVMKIVIFTWLFLLGKIGIFVAVHSPGISSFSRAIVMSLEPSKDSPSIEREVKRGDILTFTADAVVGILFKSIVKSDSLRLSDNSIVFLSFRFNSTKAVPVNRLESSLSFWGVTTDFKVADV